MAKKKIAADVTPEESLEQKVRKLADRLQPIRYTIMDDKEYALLLPDAVKDARKALYALAQQLTTTEPQP